MHHIENELKNAINCSIKAYILILLFIFSFFQIINGRFEQQKRRFSFFQIINGRFQQPKKKIYNTFQCP